jgi:hypothetical protein
MYYYGEDDDVDIEIPQEEPILRPGTPSIRNKKVLRELVRDNTKPVCLFGAVPVSFLF